MPDIRSALEVQVKHQLGKFALDLAFTIDRWPALIFGPSGAGKSTLLRILAGLESAQDAQVALGGQVLVDSAKGIRQKPGSNGVQMVTQRAALFPHLTVRQNIAFGLRGPAHAPAINHQVGFLLEVLRIESLADRQPHMISSGERQRVALARALAPQPKLLLLDEAFTGLEATLKQEVFRDLAPFFETRHIAVLHVSHDISDAFLLQMQVLKLSSGRLLTHGLPAEALVEERTLLLNALG